MFSVFLKIAIPNILTTLGGFLVAIVNIIFAGHMDDPAKLAAIGLAGLTCKIMVFSILLGVNSAQETLTS